MCEIYPGLYYYNARYYDSETSRFIQADTVLPDLSSQMLNRYSYVNNNPRIYTGPTGNILTAIIVGAIIGAGAAAAQDARGDALWKAAAAGAISGAFGAVGESMAGNKLFSWRRGGGRGWSISLPSP